MKKLIARTPSPAFGVALLALFLSLGGVSYGVATGSIDGREIKNNSVRGQDVQKRSLNGSDFMLDRVGGKAVKEESLDSTKLSAANAERLGGKMSGDLDTRWALISESGTIEAQTGGFTLTDCYSTNANCYINAGEDVRDNGLHAEIAVQNTDGTPRLGGETGTAPCGATFVACAPPNTEDNNVLVVAPRQSDGTAAAADNRFRFYVFVTGSKSG
jgi:hypothetical protein